VLGLRRTTDKGRGNPLLRSPVPWVSWDLKSTKKSISQKKKKKRKLTSWKASKDVLRNARENREKGAPPDSLRWE
jgi:hypothetical protein